MTHTRHKLKNRAGIRIYTKYSDEYYEQKEKELAPGWTAHLDEDAILETLSKCTAVGSSRNGKNKAILPEPYRAACHLCNKTKYFFTINECTQHILDVHRTYKG